MELLVVANDPFGRLPNLILAGDDEALQFSAVPGLQSALSVAEVHHEPAPFIGATGKDGAARDQFDLLVILDQGLQSETVSDLVFVLGMNVLFIANVIGHCEAAFGS